MGKDKIVSVRTETGWHQMQVHSDDGGLTWTTYDGTPVFNNDMKPLTAEYSFMFLLFVLVFVSAATIVAFMTHQRPKKPVVFVEALCDGCEGLGTVTYTNDSEEVLVHHFDPGVYQCPHCGGSGAVMVEPENE